jgi:hypothetical protein
MKNIKLLLLALLIGISTSYAQLYHQDHHSIAKYKNDIVRRGDSLFVHLKNNTVKIYVSAEEKIDEYTLIRNTFQFEDYLIDQGFFIVSQSWNKGRQYLLIRDKDGQSFILGNLPIVSPNGIFFAVTSHDEEARINANDIQVWQFIGDSISLIFHFEPNKWSPENANWSGNDSLRVFDNEWKNRGIVVRQKDHWVFRKK